MLLSHLVDIFGRRIYFKRASTCFAGLIEVFVVHLLFEDLKQVRLCVDVLVQKIARRGTLLNQWQYRRDLLLYCFLLGGT